VPKRRDAIDMVLGLNQIRAEGQPSNLLLHDFYLAG